MTQAEKEFMLFYMEQTWEEMRHIENMRERVTILVVTVASAIVGFIIQQKYSIETKPFIWFVIILGLFGLLMTLKLFQLHQMSQKRLDKWYEYFEENCGSSPKILKLRTQADKENKKQFFIISKLRHNYFWSTIHVFIVFAGFFLFTMYPKNSPRDNIRKNNTKVQIFDTTIKTIETIKPTPK